MEPTNGSPDDGQLADRLASAAPEERQQLLCELVLRRAAEILDVPSLDEESNFLENGLSSLTAVKLSKFLMDDTGIEVPLVSIVEHPTSTLLGKYLAEAYAADAA
ncbi:MULTISPECIES: acyl carrier protein [unclassified Streptomyces]|uniref:acyl carrier protein n=1 Tax=unclassified Streptomyces TaxID=2593676 RepID=UPI00336A1DE9